MMAVQSSDVRPARSAVTAKVCVPIVIELVMEVAFRKAWPSMMSQVRRPSLALIISKDSEVSVVPKFKVARAAPPSVRQP